MIYRWLSLLPLAVLYALSPLLQVFLYRIAGYRKAVIRENLKCAFFEQREKEITVLEEKFYQNLAEVACEILHTSRISPAELEQRVHLSNADDLLQWCAGRPAIVLALHKNNWEWLRAAICLQTGLILDPIYKPAHSRGLDKFLLGLRSRFGARPIAVADIPNALLQRRHKKRGYCLLADQAPFPGEAMRTLPFMGRETPFQAGVEKLARLTGYPVVFADMNRGERGNYRVSFELLLDSGEDPVQQGLLLRYVRACEAAIRRQPESWLWSHRRWKR